MQGTGPDTLEGLLTVDAPATDDDEHEACTNTTLVRLVVEAVELPCLLSWFSHRPAEADLLPQRSQSTAVGSGPARGSP